MAHALPGEKRPVSVDVGEFVRTRDALSSAYMSLSASIDRAVKAYIDHTNVVLAGDAALNISYLTQPFNAITASQVAQLALAQGGNGASTPAPIAEPEDLKGGKKKRNYKPRDPNAPKRPLTAYFRYLQETRPALATEMATARNGQTSKPGDLTKQATERWNQMTTEEQQPYKEAYQRALKDYEKEVAAYKISTGETVEDAAASPGAADEDTKIAAPVAAVAVAKEDSDTSSEEESSDDDDEETAMPPPPPPPKVASPEAKKTPKSSLKKKDKVAPSPIPPTPQFSSINPSVPVHSSSSPEASKKRKAPAIEESTEEPGKKKRGRKSKAEKAAEEEAAAAKPAIPESDASSTKKEKKKKSRKSEA